MFESAELGHAMSHADFEEEAPLLRADLLDTQYDVCAARKFPVIILVDGIEGAGKSEAVNLLNAWMDPRHILTHAFDRPTTEELERPLMWRYWRALPPKGKIGILFNNWYDPSFESASDERKKPARLEQRLLEIQRFELMLAEEGALILKFWFHLTKEAQKERLRALEKDPLTRWRARPEHWAQNEAYARYRSLAEHILSHTSTAHAPWIVVDGSDERHRAVSVGRTLLKALRTRLANENPVSLPRSAAPPLACEPEPRNLLSSLDLGLKLSRKEYVPELEKWQGRLNRLTQDPRFQERSLVVVFEGMDAAGKGSAIRRITGALDARQYHLIPVAAPTEEERAQPYLWRFWRHLPRHRHLALFDRSWYGRVLVERVEALCQDAEWMRAYGEINDFEEQMVAHGVVVVKFWLQISQEEQLRRFRQREETRFKRFKITPEDWRNREKWPAYECAVCDMIDRTSTDQAPWTLVEAEDKYFARIKVLKMLCQRLEKMLDKEPWP